MSDIVWSRRSFLKFGLTAAAVVSVAPVLQPLAVESPKFLIINDVYIYELMAQAAAGASDGVLFQIGRPGMAGAILQTALGPHSMLRWIAAPGQEISCVGGIENQSSVDLQMMHIGFLWRGMVYHWTSARGIQGLSVGGPLPVPYPLIGGI